MGNRDIERQIRAAGERAGDRVRGYADDAASGAQSLLERGRRATERAAERFGKKGDNYSRRLSNAAEDFADEANYHYRRLRRQVNRHPGATVAIVAGTIGAFLLLRRAFRSSDED
ncbi:MULTISPECIES: hypothetical protein [unclassified Rhodanobacter]|jgi:hypothetical protein|uniref:hypothetical protein n=1 Tax=unclassified Rhodanobacter TaxID=2621553 RepID=UPI00160E9F83|nr:MULTISPECIES: hypothetical protein [unclassified Rhodanobacter]MBB6241181.1 ElaB/YqjD/DUF883 family membrane-anchored ribosome-binding protein [Rhodanobacter sp. MP1X3]MBB6246788.1 ElaB/YqjD/DUF883 family membrane-anchored ribosome-binding protein [Rhodanobacter sp. A1T4]